MSAEAKRIGHDVPGGSLARLVWHVIQVTGWIGCVIVDRRRQNLITDRHYTERGFHGTRSAKQMSGHRFCGGNWNLIGLFSKNSFDRRGLTFIIQLCGGAMRVDVMDVID